MIDVYTWPTPNGHKVHIMLEETALKYRIHPINIRKGDQFKPAFLKVSPNHRIPAITDRQGPNGEELSSFESGAILIPWMRGAEQRGVILEEYPNVKRWFDEISARPAVQRGVQVLAQEQSSTPHDPKSWDIMFGKTQFQRR